MLWSLALVPIAVGVALFASGVKARLWLGVAACATMALTFVLAWIAAAADWTGRLAWSETLELVVALTPLSATVAMLVPAIALPVLGYAASHEERPGLARLIALLLVFIGGMELLVIASDLLTLLIGWELVGACSWALISHRWRDVENAASGLYAFIMTRLGDLGLFAAAMAAFAGAGSVAYDDLATLEAPYLQILAFGLLLSAASKSGQVPFAPWLFRAMAGPTSVSALLHAATMVAAGAYLVARLHPVLAAADGFSEAAIAIGLATALTGGLVALLQNHAKKLLAASTSAHFGLMFVAVGAGYPGVALLYLVAHAGFKALLFLAAGVAGDRAETFALDRMGLGRALPFMAALSAVGALALAGLPPLGGGWTKEAIVSAAGHESLWIAVGVMIAGALSAAYAMRFQRLAFGRADEPSEGEAPGYAEYAGLGALAFFTLALSVLWLPAVHDQVATLLGIEIPKSKTAEVIASLLLLGLGLSVGLLLARRYPALGSRGAPAAFADWLGLPTLIRTGLTQPFDRLARAAGWVDDHVIDALPSGVATGTRLASRAFAVRDRRVVDCGVEASAAFAAWLAKLGDQIGERIADGLPEGSARLVGMSGEDARRLQTGLSHHYYALVVFGAAVIITLLIIGS